MTDKPDFFIRPEDKPLTETGNNLSWSSLMDQGKPTTGKVEQNLYANALASANPALALELAALTIGQTPPLEKPSAKMPSGNQRPVLGPDKPQILQQYSDLLTEVSRQDKPTEKQLEQLRGLINQADQIDRPHLNGRIAELRLALTGHPIARQFITDYDNWTTATATYYGHLRGLLNNVTEDNISALTNWSSSQTWNNINMNDNVRTSLSQRGILATLTDPRISHSDKSPIINAMLQSPDRTIQNIAQRFQNLATVNDNVARLYRQLTAERTGRIAYIESEAARENRDNSRQRPGNAALSIVRQLMNARELYDAPVFWRQAQARCLEQAGSGGALAARQAAQNLHPYLFACQLHQELSRPQINPQDKGPGAKTVTSKDAPPNKVAPLALEKIPAVGQDGKPIPPQKKQTGDGNDAPPVLPPVKGTEKSPETKDKPAIKISGKPDVNTTFADQARVLDAYNNLLPILTPLRGKPLAKEHTDSLSQIIDDKAISKEKAISKDVYTAQSQELSRLIQQDPGHVQYTQWLTQSRESHELANQAWQRIQMRLNTHGNEEEQLTHLGITAADLRLLRDTRSGNVDNWRAEATRIANIMAGRDPALGADLQTYLSHRRSGIRGTANALGSLNAESQGYISQLQRLNAMYRLPVNTRMIYLDLLRASGQGGSPTAQSLIEQLRERGVEDP